MDSPPPPTGLGCRGLPFCYLSPSRHAALFTVRGDQLLCGPRLSTFIVCSLPHAVIPTGYRVRWKDARTGVKRPGFHILVWWKTDMSFSTSFPGVFIELQWNDCKPCTQITWVTLCFGRFIWKAMVVTANTTVLTLSQAIPEVLYMFINSFNSHDNSEVECDTTILIFQIWKFEAQGNKVICASLYIWVNVRV